MKRRKLNLSRWSPRKRHLRRKILNELGNSSRGRSSKKRNRRRRPRTEEEVVAKMDRHKEKLAEQIKDDLRWRPPNRDHDVETPEDCWERAGKRIREMDPDRSRARGVLRSLTRWPVRPETKVGRMEREALEYRAKMLEKIK